jgi:hypothetical protein
VGGVATLLVKRQDGERGGSAFEEEAGWGEKSGLGEEEKFGEERRRRRVSSQESPNYLMLFGWGLLMDTFLLAGGTFLLVINKKVLLLDTFLLVVNLLLLGNIFWTFLLVQFDGGTFLLVQFAGHFFIGGGTFLLAINKKVLLLLFFVNKKV